MLESVISILSADSRFSIFFDHCHRLGASSGICFNNELEFPNQVLRRAKEVGPRQALAEVLAYFDSSDVRIECALLLYSVHIEEEYTFSNGVRLIKASSLNDSSLVHFLNGERISTGGADTALLVHDYVTPKQYYSSISTDRGVSDWTKINVKTDIINMLNDTRFILSLGRHFSYGVPVVGSFEVIPDHLRFLNNGIGYGIFPEPRTGIGPEIIGIEMRKADALINAFFSLSNEHKDSVRIAMKRLNDAKIDSDWANKSINLRICLENLFYGSTDSRIAQTISERAPSYTNFTKTRARKVYGYLSKAVHTGIPPEHETITVDEITGELQKTITTYIEEGKYPTWPERKRRGILHRLQTCIRSLFDRSAQTV